MQDYFRLDSGNKIIVASIGLGLLAWLTDALTDYFYYQVGQPFVSLLLFDLPGHEIYMRSLILSLFIVFGAAMSRVVNKRLDAEAALGRHKDNLETLVNERTAELALTNEYLRLEIAEREKAEESLRESRKQLRYLSSRILTAQEAERKRISRELHDELGQALTIVKLQVRSVEKCLSKEQAGIKKDCEDILQYADRIIENVRRLSRDLSPSVLEDLGLSAAIRWMINNFEKSYGINIKADIMEINHLFPPDDQIVIYRILQETLTNIGKHSGAGTVHVAVRKQDESVACIVEDDGRGFDLPGTLKKNITEKGLGLATMEERARMLGSSLQIRSEYGKGTRISIAVPIKKGKDTHETVQYCISR